MSVQLTQLRSTPNSFPKAISKASLLECAFAIVANSGGKTGTKSLGNETRTNEQDSGVCCAGQSLQEMAERVLSGAAHSGQDAKRFAHSLVEDQNKPLWRGALAKGRNPIRGGKVGDMGKTSFQSG
jgi:hypothetical protein